MNVPVFPASRAHLAHEGQQSFAYQPQVSQRNQRHNLPDFLRQPAIANLHESTLALDAPEGMLDDG